MRKRITIAAALLVVVALGLPLIASAGAAPGKIADHALFDETGGDTAVLCRTTNEGPFNVYLSFRAINGDAILRVTFQDGDFVEYPIPDGTSFSLQQVAGTSADVDERILVTSEGTGQLVGWMSASRLAGTQTRVRCRTRAAPQP
jgi:hypothetical protein